MFPVFIFIVFSLAIFFFALPLLFVVVLMKLTGGAHLEQKVVE